jgi:hypothetical protein
MVGPDGIEPPLPAPSAGVLATPYPLESETGPAATTVAPVVRTRRATAPVTPQTELQRTIAELVAERLRPVPARNSYAPVTVEQGRRNRQLLAWSLGIRDDYEESESEREGGG